jgi:hypothetical protein
MIWKFLLFVAISGVLHVVVKAVASRMPREKPVPTDEWPPEMLAAVARRANFYGTLGALLLFLILLPAWIGGAWWLDSLAWPRVQPGELLAVPLQLWRLARGGVAAWILAGALALAIFKLVATWRYDLYLAAGNEQFGFRASAFFFWWLVWVLPFCIEYELHAIGNSAYFSQDALAVRESLLWPPERHSYQQLTAIELARPFDALPTEIGRPAECRFTFADGFALTDVPFLTPFDSQGNRATWEATCELVSQHAGVPVQVTPEIR